MTEPAASDNPLKLRQDQAYRGGLAGSVISLAQKLLKNADETMTA